MFVAPSAPKVFKSELFAYQGKVNITMMALQDAFVKQLNVAAVNPIDGWTLHYMIGKGDWKYKKEWLQERRFWSQNSAESSGICRRCYARGCNWMDVVWEKDWYPHGDTALDTAFSKDIPSLVISFIYRVFPNLFQPRFASCQCHMAIIHAAPRQGPPAPRS